MMIKNFFSNLVDKLVIKWMLHKIQKQRTSTIKQGNYCVRISTIKYDEVAFQLVKESRLFK